MAEPAAGADDGSSPETRSSSEPAPATKEKKKPEAKAKRKLRWRPWLRAMHRDFGYLIIGLTFVYALSGLAVNHIADWDPNFTQVNRTHQVKLPLPEDEVEAGAEVLRQLGVKQTTDEAYLEEGTLEIILPERTYTVEMATGKTVETGQEQRFFLRLANWLHLNRGKKAWTYVADSYAVLLLFLAVSGLFMIPGRKGLVGRGAIIATIGAAVPILYVVLSGGP